MIKHTTSLILLVGFAFGQIVNPCEDERYLQIKNKSFDDMSEREYSYFIKMDEECKRFEQNNSVGKVENQNQQPTSTKKESVNNFSLTNNQLKEFNKRKLSIEIVTKGVGSFNTQMGLAVGESWRKWTAYIGFEKISEEQFFSLAGYKDESLKAKGFRNKHKGFIVGGILGSIFGLSRIGTAMGIIDDRSNIGFDTPDYRSVYDAEGKKADGIAFQGSVIFGLGVGSIVYGSIQLGKNWAPYATVQGIAEEYNNKLIKEISNK